MAAIALCAPEALAEQPHEALDRNWLINSLLSGSRLANRNIFDIAFETGPNPQTIKFVWVASSDGLHSYDGYAWRRYGTSEGLPSNFVRSVHFTRTGKLWVGTDSGAGVFDGKSFNRLGSDKGLAGQSVRRIVENPDGDLWFCSDSWPRAHGSGGLTTLREGQWRSWHQKDGLPSDYVVNYFRASDGRQFVATAEGVAQMTTDGRFTMPLAKLARTGVNWGSTSLAESPTFGLIISNGNDVFVSKNGGWRVYSGGLRHTHGIARTSDGRIIACAAKGLNQRVFAEWAGDRWQPLSSSFPITHDYIENLREGPDGSIYAVGFDCVRRWQRRGSEWHVYPGMPRPLCSDADGSVWLMDERGFFRAGDRGWKSVGNAGKGLLPTPTGFWAWSSTELAFWKRPAASYATVAQTGLTQYKQVNLDRQGNPWAIGWDAASKLQISGLVNGSWVKMPLPDTAWAVGAADPNSGMWYLLSRKNGESQLLKIGEKTKTYPVPAALISQYPNSIYADTRGDVWLMGDTGLHRWRKDKGPEWEKISAIQGASVAGCLERGNKLWFIVDGTLGGKSGLASFSGGEWKTVDTDPIFSWSSADDHLLLGSKGKFYLVDSQNPSSPVSVRLPEPEPVLSTLEDRSDNYWLGTPGGAYIFHPQKASPETIVVSSDNEVLEGSPFRNRVRGVSRFNPSAPAANFTYSWRVDTGRWTPYTGQQERSFSAQDLPLGVHHLFVRVRDNSMNVDSTPADITFRVIQLPVQERRWFWPALIALGALLTALTITTAAARFKLSHQASKLEEMVEARTAELKVREQELQRTNRALQRTNDDLRQFSWAASHDLQEPLRMVVTYTQFLAKRYGEKLDETGQQFMGYAVDGAHRAQALLHALLEYWQVSEGGDATVPAPVDSATTLKKALTNLEIMMLESGAVVSVSHLPTLVVSEVALLQVFQNLVSNAIKYAKPGQPPQISVSASGSDRTDWQFSVNDNGIGIAPEHCTMIFQLFKRLNGKRYSGTGVGLALCAKIVENLGGRIWVESEPGSGSTFHFTVPHQERS